MFVAERVWILYWKILKQLLHTTQPHSPGTYTLYKSSNQRTYFTKIRYVHYSQASSSTTIPLQSSYPSHHPPPLDRRASRSYQIHPPPSNHPQSSQPPAKLSTPFSPIFSFSPPPDPYFSSTNPLTNLQRKRTSTPSPSPPILPLLTTTINAMESSTHHGPTYAVPMLADNANDAERAVKPRAKAGFIKNLFTGPKSDWTLYFLWGVVTLIGVAAIVGGVLAASRKGKHGLGKGPLPPGFSSSGPNK
ncbi:MAG: hypothetical protein LQ352_006232 [Teloschistes flavicans]|nr:MAG: hypothetical protein LQ352_006232 [Teloschistes flavicans]